MRKEEVNQKRPDGILGIVRNPSITKRLVYCVLWLCSLPVAHGLLDNLPLDFRNALPGARQTTGGVAFDVHKLLAADSTSNRNTLVLAGPQAGIGAELTEAASAASELSTADSASQRLDTRGSLVSILASLRTESERCDQGRLLLDHLATVKASHHDPVGERDGLSSMKALPIAIDRPFVSRIERLATMPARLVMDRLGHSDIVAI